MIKKYLCHPNPADECHTLEGTENSDQFARVTP
jgi:hypothetical protein